MLEPEAKQMDVDAGSTISGELSLTMNTGQHWQSAGQVCSMSRQDLRALEATCQHLPHHARDASSPPVLSLELFKFVLDGGRLITSSGGEVRSPRRGPKQIAGTDFRPVLPLSGRGVVLLKSLQGRKRAQPLKNITSRHHIVASYMRAEIRNTEKLSPTGASPLSSTSTSGAQTRTRRLLAQTRNEQ